MATTDNKALARRWFEEVWNQGREATINELLAPDCVIHGLGDEVPGVSGRDLFRTFYRPFRAAFPDIHVDVNDALSEGDQTAVRIHCRATHRGELMGVSATGAAVTLTGIIWMRWHNGQIVEAWNEFDAAGLARQIGAAGVGH